MKYYSKKDWWLGAIIWLTMVAGLLLTGNQALTGSTIALILFAVLALGIGFIFWIWFATFYVLGEDSLVVVSGPSRTKILYSDLKSVKTSNNPLSSSALSMDRLEVLYGRMGVIYISPRDKASFLTGLSIKCPNLSISI